MHMYLKLNNIMLINHKDPHSSPKFVVNLPRKAEVSLSLSSLVFPKYLLEKEQKYTDVFKGLNTHACQATHQHHREVNQ